MALTLLNVPPIVLRNLLWWSARSILYLLVSGLAYLCCSLI